MPALLSLAVWLLVFPFLLMKLNVISHIQNHYFVLLLDNSATALSGVCNKSSFASLFCRVFRSCCVGHKPSLYYGIQHCIKVVDENITRGLRSPGQQHLCVCSWLSRHLRMILQLIPLTVLQPL